MRSFPATIIQLGSVVSDSATGLTGTVTHLNLEMDGSGIYSFQPKGLNPETREPVDSTWLVRDRIKLTNAAQEIPTPELPHEVLGTIVTDKASGFSGMAVSLCLHINGCVHINVQPTGVTKNGAAIRVCNFDIRRLKGKAIKPLTKEEKKVSEARNPSPADVPQRYRPV